MMGAFVGIPRSAPSAEPATTIADAAANATGTVFANKGLVMKSSEETLQTAVACGLCFYQAQS
jgi:hypothetical protein